MSKEFFKQARQLGLTHVGQAWYEACDLEAAMAVMKDRHNLFARHADWLAAAMRTENDIRSAGLIPVRAVIRADAFVRYCRAAGLDIDAGARNNFASLIAHQAQLGGLN